MHIIKLTVVPFDSLAHSDLIESGFDSVSYGDAEQTLVQPKTLIDEIKDDSELAPLVSELRLVESKGLLIALDG